MGYLFVTAIFLAGIFGIIPFWAVIIAVLLAAIIKAYFGSSTRPNQSSVSLAAIVLIVIALGGGGIFVMGPEFVLSEIKEFWNQQAPEEQPVPEKAAGEVPQSPQQPTQQPAKPAVASAIRELDAATFPVEVLLATNPVLVEFVQPSCHSCREMEPIVQKLASDYQGLVTIYRVNIKQSPQLNHEYAVRRTPTFVLFDQGKEVQRFAGVTEYKLLSTALLLQAK